MAIWHMVIWMGLAKTSHMAIWLVFANPISADPIKKLPNIALSYTYNFNAQDGQQKRSGQICDKMLI